jgi:hypothetical protein
MTGHMRRISQISFGAYWMSTKPWSVMLKRGFDIGLKLRTANENQAWISCPEVDLLIRVVVEVDAVDLFLY